MKARINRGMISFEEQNRKRRKEEKQKTSRIKKEVNNGYLEKKNFFSKEWSSFMTSFIDRVLKYLHDMLHRELEDNKWNDLF